MRQSFWLTRRAVSSLMTIALSPPGPSVMEVSVCTATRTPSAISVSVASTVRTNLRKPSRESVRSISRVGNAGRMTVVSLFMRSRRNGTSRWSPCRCDTYRKSGLQTSCMTSAGRVSLRGNGNHEAKNAGSNHGSQTIVTPRVRTRMPACPMEMACMFVPAVAGYFFGGSIDCLPAVATCSVQAVPFQ